MKVEQTDTASKSMDHHEVDPLTNGGLYRYCMSLTCSRQEAEDLMQETLLKAEVRRRACKAHANPEALLLRMAKNSWIDKARRSALYREILKQAHSELSDNSLHDRDENGKERMAAAFQVLIRNLTPDQRITLLMRDVFGYSSAECATYLSTTEGAVKSLLYRARRALDPIRTAQVNDLQREWETHSDPSSADVDEMLEAYVHGDIARLLQLVSIGGYQTPAIGKAVSFRQTARVDSKMRVSPYVTRQTPRMQWVS